VLWGSLFTFTLESIWIYMDKEKLYIYKKAIKIINYLVNVE